MILNPGYGERRGLSAQEASLSQGDLLSFFFSPTQKHDAISLYRNTLPRSGVNGVSARTIQGNTFYLSKRGVSE